MRPTVAGAVGFLPEVLANGERATKDVFTEVAGAGFSKGAMHRAKRKVGVATVKSGMSGGWTWRLPKPEGGDADTEDGEGSGQIGPPSLQPSECEPLAS